LSLPKTLGEETGDIAAAALAALLAAVVSVELRAGTPCGAGCSCARAGPASAFHIKVRHAIEASPVGILIISISQQPVSFYRHYYLACFSCRAACTNLITSVCEADGS